MNSKTTRGSVERSRVRWRRGWIAAMGVAIFPALAAVAQRGREVSSRLVYPETKRHEVVDYHHGHALVDPYRWLEDDNAPATKAWVEAQNKVTAAHLESVPERPRIRERLKQLWNYERFGVPFREGGRLFYTRNDGLQNQSVLYTVDRPDGPARVVLDPNQLSSDGTVALTGAAVSRDGRLLAYGVASGGSDWQEWRVRDIETGRDRADRLQWIKFADAVWSADGRGLYYSRYDEPKPGEQLKGANFFHKIYYHKLGTAQGDDVLVYERPDHKDWLFDSEVSDDGRYLVITVAQGTDTRKRIFYRDLQDAAGRVIELLNEFDASYAYVGNAGECFWFLTDLNAPRSRLIEIDVRNPGRDRWRELIPQARETLERVSVVNHQFLAGYLKDAYSLVRVFGTNGSPVRALSLPGIGSAAGFRGRPGDPETFYSFTSFAVPGAIYHYDLATGASRVFRQPKVAFNPDDYETRQIFFQSKDRTRVPMFITHRKGLVLDGNQPTYLYGYGGFNISITPRFSTPMVAWLEMGGVYAVANLRGGGEYGEDWHQAGMKLRKQNVFDDFIAAAEWLIANDYTRPSRLAIAGGSNGGLLVGACMNQRPELFGACLPAVGVMDMLRFHKFTIGWAWTSDYGSAEDLEEYKALRAYSPYHNLKRGTRYPATLILTADHDDRVVPAHSFKYAAALQHAQAGSAPTLIRIETRAGHGAGKPVSKLIDEWTDQWAFLVRELRMTVALP